MNPTIRSIVTIASLLALVGVATGGEPDAATIGRQIFLDTGLSEPVGQACITCHHPNSAFADPRAVSPGAVSGRIGNRNAPTLMYAALIPAMVLEDVYDEKGEGSFVWEGGLFHDGRARDQFEQVQQPFFEANEMNLPDPSALAARLRQSKYAGEMKQWVGESRWDDDQQLNFHAYRALVEFLKEPMFRPFDARIDDFLGGDEKALNASERRGLEVFKSTGKCAECHLLGTGTWPQPLLSDYGYDNVGAPSRGKKDPGLGGHTGRAGELGQFRAPTLRNIALTAPYMHNGSIKTLQEVMEFYNKRDLEPERWGPTDYPETVNHDDMGNLKLSDQEVTDLVALMAAFTDRSLLKMIAAGESFPAAPPGVPSTASREIFFPDWRYRPDPPSGRKIQD